MADISSEVGDNRRNIRRETDAFLDGIVAPSYSQLDKASFSDILAGTQTLSLSPPESALSGARTAILPLTISLAAKTDNGVAPKRLQFTMLINPNTMNHGKTSAVHPAYTRRGYLTQMWGPNQDLITATGTSAAFMVGGEGLTVGGRKRSFAFVNMLALIYAYRNNGYQLLDVTALKPAITRVINVVHGAELTYDNHVFMGHFNTFTLDENSDRPYLFDYNFDFIISSLSENYNEVRGHFIPIERSPIANSSTLVNQVGKNNG